MQVETIYKLIKLISYISLLTKIVLVGYDKTFFNKTRACWIWDDYSQLRVTRLVGYHLTSNARLWNNC